MNADTRPIFDLLQAYPNAARIAASNFHPIRECLEAGCTVRDDIVPTMERLLLRNRSITSFSYFRNAIIDARDKRIQAALLAEKQKNAPPDPEAIHRRARAISFKVRTLKQIVPEDDRRFLREYEDVHGQVKLPATNGCVRAETVP